MLRVKTPTKSGKTAGSWGSEIVKTSSGIDAFITNSNVTKNGIPIPILLRMVMVLALVDLRCS